MLDQETVSHICAKVRKGAKMFVGNNHLGHQKVKLVYGPFGVFTERYEVESSDLAMINARLKNTEIRKAS
jgi:hypothetical protein